MTDSKAYNIAIYPPKEIRREAVSLSNNLARRGGLFTLDDKNIFPHVSIYMLELPIDNLEKVIFKLATICKGTKSMSAASEGIRENPDGFIDIPYVCSKELSGFQKNVIEQIDPLREGLIREKDKARLATVGEAERTNILEYGYRYVGAEYVPHLSVSKLPEYKEDVLKGAESGYNFSFSINQIGIFELGDHGTCKKIVKLFDLLS